MPYPINRWRLIAIVGIILFSLILTSVIILEIFLKKKEQIKFPFHNVLYPYVGFRPPANAIWRSELPSPSSRFKEPSIEYTNPDSLRIPTKDYVLSKQKPVDELRIAVIGGSTVRIGTRFEVTLPGSLKRTLLSKYPGARIEVINGGIISAISRQELIFLLTTLVDYNPDILITYDGINDSGQMLYYERRPNFPYNFRVVEKAWEEYVTPRKDSLWNLVWDRSSILKWFWPQKFGDERILEKIPAHDLIENQVLRRGFAEAYVDNWEKIHHISQAYGIKTLYALQPTSLFALFENEAEKKSVSTAQEKNLYANYLVYQEFRAAVKRFSLAHPELTVLDLSALLPSEAFFDGAHVFDEINSSIAEKLTESLSEHIEKKINQ